MEHGKQKLIMSDWGSSVDEPKKAQEFYNLLQFIYSREIIHSFMAGLMQWLNEHKHSISCQFLIGISSLLVFS